MENMKTVMLHKGCFCNGCITKRFCISQQICHLMIFFLDCFMIKEEYYKNYDFLYFPNNTCFVVKGKLISTKSVLWCSRCKIHFYVAARVLLCSPMLRVESYVDTLLKMWYTQSKLYPQCPIYTLLNKHLSPPQLLSATVYLHLW
jgi:hypothetical protein